MYRKLLLSVAVLFVALATRAQEMSVRIQEDIKGSSVLTIARVNNGTFPAFALEDNNNVGFYSVHDNVPKLRTTYLLSPFQNFMGTSTDSLGSTFFYGNYSDDNLISFRIPFDTNKAISSSYMPNVNGKTLGHFYIKEELHLFSYNRKANSFNIRSYSTTGTPVKELQFALDAVPEVKARFIKRVDFRDQENTLDPSELYRGNHLFYDEGKFYLVYFNGKTSKYTMLVLDPKDSSVELQQLAGNQNFAKRNYYVAHGYLYDVALYPNQWLIVNRSLISNLKEREELMKLSAQDEELLPMMVHTESNSIWRPDKDKDMNPDKVLKKLNKDYVYVFPFVSLDKPEELELIIGGYTIRTTSSPGMYGAGSTYVEHNYTHINYNTQTKQTILPLTAYHIPTTVASNKLAEIKRTSPEKPAKVSVVFNFGNKIGIAYLDKEDDTVNIIYTHTID